MKKTSENVARAKVMQGEGKTLWEIADHFGVHENTIGNWLNEARAEKRPAQPPEHDIRLNVNLNQADLEGLLDAENILAEQNLDGRIPDWLLLIVRAVQPELMKKYNLIPWKKVLKRSGKIECPKFTYEVLT